MPKSQLPRVSTFFACAALLSTLAFASDRNSVAKLSDLPTQAQSSVSSALGRDVSKYHVRGRRGGYEAENPRQGLTTQFTSSGVDIGTATDHWRIVLRGYGYGDKLIALRQISPRAEGNRIEYRRGLLTEWYLNGPLGLEQGFTIRSRPNSRGNDQPLTISLGITGSLRAVPENEDHSLKLTQENGDPVLRYVGLTASDSTGKALTATLQVTKQELHLEIDDSSARYPIVIDPTIQDFMLTASDGVDSDAFGASVATSGDTVVVGAYGATYNGDPGPGAVYVFVKPQQGWRNMTQSAKLTASDGQDGDYFGGSVSISGNTIVVGAPDATLNGNLREGAAYVFVEPPGGWTNMTETAKLTASDGVPSGLFGLSVGISGNTVAIGSPVGGQPGRAYVFVEPTNGWTSMTETAELAASNGTPNDDFGYAVSVSSNTIVVGGGQCDGDCPGTAYVYIEPANGWVNTTETAQLTPSDGGGEDFFGGAVSVDVPTVAVGASNHGNDGAGAVYVFVEPVGGWVNMTQTAELSVQNSARSCLGNSVSISGNVILAGANCTHGDTGAAYVFVKPSDGWKNSSKFAARLSIPFQYQSDNFGGSVAISGTTGIVGASGAPTSRPCHNGQCTQGPGETFVFTEK